MPKLPWKCWYEVAKIRDDLKSGDLPLSMFAADLYEVLMKRGKHPVYENQKDFFALTYPTFNLRQLVRDVVLRLAGKNDKAVRQLELTYGGGKTHSLITMYHLVSNPDTLPDLPAVAEFKTDIGQELPRCIVAGLCFDKLDVEKGMEVKSPDGKVRRLHHPWSVLAYQIAGDDGLKVLHSKDKAEERESAPAENVLIELLEPITKKGTGILILIDEVLMFAREKAGLDKEWRGRLINFFQYLTQAVSKVNRCCIVASLLASDPEKSDTFGKELQSELYNIFQREREEAIEPVAKEDIAEVLRRRFFTPESMKNKDEFKQHVMLALKGIGAIDEQTAKQGAGAEDRFVKSYPFHPDLTEVFYSKWTTLERFQKTRGVLRTFALALREAEKWDTSPLIGPAVFLTAPKDTGISEAMRELITVADTAEWEGKKQAWTGILDSEINGARQIQTESVGLRNREIEQAVVATFLHSQPLGKDAKTRDLMVLLGATKPDKIELEKGLARWTQTSYWLDDSLSATAGGNLPGTWRLGNKPNLNQMHANASRQINDDTVNARLLDEIQRCKSLTANASGLGVRVHTLPTRPKDIEDDGSFHYVVLGPNAASESGNPSAEACRYLNETTGPDRPRVYRNSVILLVPSRDGLEITRQRVREYLAWEIVREDVKQQAKDGNVDPSRAQTLQINIDKSKGRIPDAIRQAYCVVVTVNEKNEDQAFKLSIFDDFHFNIIKNDPRSRIRDAAITPETLLPNGPYSLWKPGETSRRVKDLAGAFAQLPHLPKMLRTSAILDTLAGGCDSFSFILKLQRPDKTIRTFWGIRPDDNALNDPALELVLPEAAELTELPADLLIPGKAPELWKTPEILFSDMLRYFAGGTVVVDNKGTYTESLSIPKVPQPVLEGAVTKVVERGDLWLQVGPASILKEPIPTGILIPEAKLSAPPARIPATELLSENLPQAWVDKQCSAYSILTALSLKRGATLPWHTIIETINDALHARFISLEVDSQSWPCDISSAQSVKFRMAEITSAPGNLGPRMAESNAMTAFEELSPSQLQDFTDIVPKILEIKTKANIPIKFGIRIEVGDGKTKPDTTSVEKINRILEDIKNGFGLK